MKRDPVTAELRDALFRRDKGCVFRGFIDHVCRDQWGEPHSPYDLSRLQVEHVKDQPRMGKRAPSDLAHCLLLCAGANIGVPSKDERIFERSYLAAVNG